MEQYQVIKLCQILLWNMDIEILMMFKVKFNSGKNLTVKVEFNKEKRYRNLF